MSEALVLESTSYGLSLMAFCFWGRHDERRLSGASYILPALRPPGPPKGVQLPSIPVSYEAEDLLPHGCDGGEVSVSDDATLQDREPDLHLVHPRGVLRRVPEMKASIVATIE